MPRLAVALFLILPDVAGRPHDLDRLHGERATVVAFVGTGCPVAKLYAPRLAALAATYEPRGVAFVAIDPNTHDTLEELARFAADHGITFPVLRDPDQAAADRFGVERTPEVVVFDSTGAVRYRGRIDDQYAPGPRRDRPTRHDLAAALDDLLAGRPVSVSTTAAVGCRIDRVRDAARGGPTYCRDIASIVQRHCQACHRRGQIGPFPLTNFAETRRRAAMIREVVADGRMPPWHADPAFGRFTNDPRLSDTEKQLLFAWIDAGCPAGDAADLPPPPHFTDGWSIPQPDAVVAMPRVFDVPAEGTVEYQYIDVDPGFTEDKWLRAAEVRPGNRAVVHHCSVFLREPGCDDLYEFGALGSHCLVAYASGTPPMTLPDGMAKRIPAGWHLLFIVHYTPVGTPQSDRTSLGLVFADPRQVRQEVATKLVVDPDLHIPPGAADHTITHAHRLPADTLLLALFPHMHLRGKSFRYEAVYPNGRIEVLLNVPRYDFNWQHRYVFAEPKRLPKGTEVRCTAVYDNSAANPANPDPTVTVKTGLQSTDEMFNGYYDIALADQDLTRPAMRAWPAAAAGLAALALALRCRAAFTAPPAV